MTAINFDEFIRAEIDMEILKKITGGTLISFDQDPSVIQPWLTANCKGAFTVKLQLVLFSDQEDAALFRVFWA